MSEIRTIVLNRSVADSLEEEAELYRKELKEKKTFLLNVMSSPGSGKTTTLIKLINLLKKDYRIGILEADIDSNVDAIKISKETSVPSIQLHTGGMCHLDASMTSQGVNELVNQFGGHFDFIVLENIGNLVCPAEFDTGSSLNMVILSVPEGSDKPLKYPLMFEKSDLVLINKIDAIEYFNFDYNIVESFIYKRNPKAKIFRISAKKDIGLGEVAHYLAALIDEWRK